MSQLLANLERRLAAAIDPEERGELLAQIAACVDEQKLQGDLVVRLAAEPVVIHAAGALKRER